MTYIYETGLSQESVYDHMHSGNKYGIGGHGIGTWHLYVGYHSLLDVGCGRTAFPSEVKQNCGIERVGACEISRVALRYQLEKHGFKGALWADMTKSLPYEDNEFDVITSFDVLEHLAPEGVDTAIREMARVALHRLVLTIASIQAHNRGPGEELLHLTLQPIEWWHGRLKALIPGCTVRTERVKTRIKRGRQRYSCPTIVELR